MRTLPPKGPDGSLCFGVSIIIESNLTACSLDFTHQRLIAKQKGSDSSPRISAEQTSSEISDDMRPRDL